MAAADVVALLLAIGVMLVSLPGTLGLDPHLADIDQIVYEQTLASMQSGASYYDATANALTAKEGTPPSQVRSVRPPTMFLVLEPFAPGAWRWIAAGLSLVVVLTAWRMAREMSVLAGPIAVILVGVYLRSALPYLYLHAELWGFPFVLGGLLAVRRRRWAVAAALMVAAILIRELYAVYLIAALVWLPRRRPFVVGGAVVVVAGAVHAWLASRILDPNGRETPYPNHASVAYVLDMLAPSGGNAGWMVGAAVTVLGVVVLAVLSRRATLLDARVALTAAIPLLLATTTVGRSYWALSVAPVLAVYASMVVGWIPVGSVARRPEAPDRLADGV